MLKNYFLLISLSVLAASASWADSLPQLLHQEIKNTSQENMEQLLRNISTILIAAEKKQLKIPSRDKFFCHKAGWTFYAKANCQLGTLSKGCGANQVRCATWTGNKNCVKDQNSSLENCLKNTHINSKKKASYFFRSELAASNWLLIWKFVKHSCEQEKTNSCVALKKLAKKIKPPSPKKHHLQKSKKISFFDFKFNWSILPKAQAQELCQLSPDGKIFTRKDGSKIHLLFGEHQASGDTGFASLLTVLASSPPPSHETLENFIDETLDENKTNLQAIEEQSEAIKALSQNGQIEWVAWEALPNSYSKTTDEEWLMQTTISLDILKEHNIPQEKIDQMLAYSWGPFFDERFTGKPWAQRPQPFAFDNDQLKYEQQRLEPKIYIYWDELNTKEFARLQQIATRVLDEGGQVSSEEMTNLPQSFKPKDQKKVIKWLTSLREFGRLNEERNKLAANILINRPPSSGAIVIGGAHKNLTKHLESLCQSLAPDGTQLDTQKMDR